MSFLLNHKHIFLQLIIIFIIFVNLASVISPLQNKYFSSDYWERFPSFENLYNNSQYMIKNPTAILPDETVYAYSGGLFLNGINPILFLPDVPPMGKYMIGLSILLFNNEHIYSLFFGLLSIFLLYLVGLQIFRNSLLALISPLLWSFEPLFKNQFIYTPLLDTAQLSFILAGFYFFNKGLDSKGYKPIAYFLLFNIFLGLFISTKFYMSGFILLFSTLTVLVLRKYKKHFFQFIITTPLSVLILLSSYSKMLSYGFSFRDILGTQK